MKSIFSSRRNKSPHTNEEAEKTDASFFSKESKTPFFNGSSGLGIQTKLTVGQPGDKYEKEADTMADAVVNKTSKPDIQNKEISSIQRESLTTPQEDEKLGTAEQRMEEDKLIQEKPEINKMEQPEEEMVSKKEGEEEEGMINKMEGDEEEGMINKMEGEEEEMVSKKEDEEETVQTKSNTANQTASNGLSQQIKSKSGKGKSLSKGTKAEMESSFGTDFSDVNIHTDNDAVKMNKELGAQAFTYGKDVYFNSGKYNPDSTKGKHLLAHELTHVVQQTGMVNKMIQRSCYDEYGICIAGCKRIIPETDKRRRALCYAECSEELGRCRRDNPDDEYRRVPVPEPDGIPWWVWGIGILGAGALSLADGPLPFGEAAAASLLISLGIIKSEDSEVTN